MINRYSKQRGRVIDYRDVVYGYMRWVSNVDSNKKRTNGRTSVLKLWLFQVKTLFQPRMDQKKTSESGDWLSTSISYVLMHQ